MKTFIRRFAVHAHQPYSFRFAAAACCMLLIWVQGSYAQSVDTVWNEGWEGDWSENWSVDFGTWEVGTPTSGPGSAHGGLACAATVLAGNYSDGASTRLISPSIIVPDSLSNPRLRFWHWFSFSTSDSGYVLIRIGTGAWQKIGGPYVGTGGGVWTMPSLDLSAYAGLSVQLAFYFTSHAPWTDAGWYIDDITVLTGPKTFHNPENWEEGIGDWYADYGTWQVGVPTSGPMTAYSGNNCAATVLTGNYIDDASTRLISPSFEVPDSSQSPRLRFLHWFSFSVSDTGRVLIRVGTGPWQTLGGPYVGTGGGVWTLPSLDLKAYAGMTVQLAFYFASHSPWADAGWYVDDVAIVTGPKILRSPEDWETGIGDWYADSGTWQVGVPTSGPGIAHSGTKCAATVLAGNYIDDAASRLTSPQFAVPDSDHNPHLRFWHWYSFSTSDTGYVQIRVKGGPWLNLGGPYTGTGGGTWTTPSLDLLPYAGMSAQIGFSFSSHAPWADLGWYVDDVTVSGYVASDVRALIEVPKQYMLGQNFPNPFNPTTMIRYAIPGAGDVRLEVYDVLGRVVAELVDERQSPGTYQAILDGAALSSGVYFYRLTVGNYSVTKSMLLLR